MWRARQIVFYVAVLACAVFLYWQRSRPQPEKPKNVGDTSEQAVVAAQLLAWRSRGRDRTRERPTLATPSWTNRP